MVPVAEGVPELSGLGLLTWVYPPGLMDRVVAACGRGEQRRRLLPARLVVCIGHPAAPGPQSAASFGGSGHHEGRQDRAEAGAGQDAEELGGPAGPGESEVPDAHGRSRTGRTASTRPNSAGRPARRTGSGGGGGYCPTGRSGPPGPCGPLGF
ncbi:transposase domain-containing protein [Streptomyces sp. NPDC005209]|uniref:transposase domain-containing protein n=1 Tax=Streptomyces sp. NPDC005209 TaxID=3156715 RepID=UPI0033BADBDA